HLYPSMSAHNEQGSKAAIRKEGMLYCRCKYIRIWGPGKKKIAEEAIVFLVTEEADTGCHVNSEVLQHSWRGTTRKGGSHVEHRRDLQSNGEPNPTRQTVQSYTFGDGFCGAGGVSRGALQA